MLVNRPKKQDTLSARKMINSLPPAHFEVYKVFVCVHNVLCAVQVAFPSKLMLVPLGASVYLVLVSPERGAPPGGGEGQKGSPMLSCYHLRAQCAKVFMAAHGLCERGINLPFGD